MSTLTAARTATLPRVNLLPPEIEEQRRAKKLQSALGVGVVASLGVVAALVLVANGQVNKAEDQLAASKTQGSRLQAKADEYSRVPQVYAAVDAAEARLTQAMGKEVRWSYYLNDLSLRIPSNVWLTTMTMNQNVDEVPTAAPVAAAGAQYGVTGIGDVKFQGTAFKHNDVAAWLDSLAKQKGYTQAYFTNSKKTELGGRDVVDFSSEVTVTDDALSKRYTQKAGS